MKALLAVLPLIVTGVIGVAQAVASSPPAGDLWLEEVHGTRALEQVRAWNKAGTDVLERQPGFAQYRRRALALLSDRERIAAPTQVIGDNVLNLWRDADHPRGLWRIAPVDGFSHGHPVWRVLIDVDALGRSEHRSWVFERAVCRAPAYDRCMVALADGGTDAAVQREFDLASGRFVTGGFVLPEAKSDVAWDGADALFVESDFGPGTLTRSGYGRLLKRWRRGGALTDAPTVLAAPESDVGVAAGTFADGMSTHTIAVRSHDEFHADTFHVKPDGGMVRSPLPQDAVIRGIMDGEVIAQLFSPWHGLPTGALAGYRLDDLLAGRPLQVERVFVPDPHQAVEQVVTGGTLLWVKLLDDVSGKLIAISRTADGPWTARAMPLPGDATITLHDADDRRATAYVTVEGMLLPPALYAISPNAAPTIVQRLPARFDASAMVVTQHFARSKDGTRIPYFLVRRKDARGPTPALIHAYGGFNISQTPTYLVGQPYRAGPAALFWVEEGNAYVLANIRGGGEYGPAWQDQTLREKHQNAFDDLHAVAEDLVRTGVTMPRRIAVSGRSNGGLLAAVAITQRPDLYGAAIIGSPLIDMQRYTHLLAGASWISEYGDPDVPADWAFMARYSPYQALRAGVHYPVPFIYTSTKDDRVHPGHARRFAARLEQLGDRFFYDEAIEGGHAAGADDAEDAQRAALIISYLNLQLPPAQRP